MEYRKETHFIVAYDGENMRGKWDILTNEYVGVRGSVVKSKPQAFSSANIVNMNPCFQSAFQSVLNGLSWRYTFTPEIGQRLEEIISVGLRVSDRYDMFRHLLDNKTKLNKACVAFLNENYGGIYSIESMSAYNTYLKYKSLVDKCGDHKEWVLRYLSDINKAIPVDFVEGMVLRAIHEKVFYSTGYSGTDIGHIINDWYAMVTAMGDTLEVKHNILSNYRILQWTYNEYKKAHYDENLNKFNNLPWLYYENDNYIVKPLLTRADFHKEAEVQQNCVERMYMELVVQGDTHVVAIRLKSNPDIPYITCEVSNDGYIRQYLLRFNRHPNSEMDINFKDEYKNHLRSSLSK